ncbi:vWA domain-containing protein [Alicyclobacillus macrosporangiidus]|uniref:vWA domain-containing protein n=1 Tax=Alicyclobacillus macrosporangiidus TaxID=392015 RepID=UPI00049518A3|nr:VWA domain-containing protein [Alicyclobacillus macrosporangiidus]
MERLTAEEFGSLTAGVVKQVANFGAWLRPYGFQAGISETLTAIAALTQLDIERMDQVCCAFRSVYCRTPSQWHMFPRLFERYFCNRQPRLEQKHRLLPEEGGGDGSESARTLNHPLVQTVQGTLAGRHPDDGERYALRAHGQALQDVLQITRLAVRALNAPPSRRAWRRGRERIDMRRTIRLAMRRAGEPMTLQWRTRRPDKPRVILVLDISGSMKPYSEFFTALAWSFTRVRVRTQIFLFSTRLLRVTALIARHAVTGIPSANLPGLKGGTRIGKALTELMNRHGGLLNRHTCVVIASDGFDAGDPLQLHSAMRDLAARVGRVIWINPLLAEPDYQPTASGMSAALPYVDAFVDVHDVSSWRKAVSGGALHATGP